MPTTVFRGGLLNPLSLDQFMRVFSTLPGSAKNSQPFNVSRDTMRRQYDSGDYATRLHLTRLIHKARQKAAHA